MKDVYPEKTVKYCILKYPTTSIQQNTYATRNRHLESFYSKNTLYHFILSNPQPPTIKPQKRKYYLFFVSYTLTLSSQHCFAISRSNSTLDRSVSISSLATMKLYIWFSYWHIWAFLRKKAPAVFRQGLSLLTTVRFLVFN